MKLFAIILLTALLAATAAWQLGGRSSRSETSDGTPTAVAKAEAPAQAPRTRSLETQLSKRAALRAEMLRWRKTQGRVAPVNPL